VLFNLIKNFKGRTKVKKGKDWDRTRQLLLLLLYEEKCSRRKPVSKKKISELYGGDDSKLQKDLKALVKKGFLKLISSNCPSTDWRCYNITKEGRGEIEKFLFSPKFLQKLIEKNKDTS
jgi:hypothetical protein